MFTPNVSEEGLRSSSEKLSGQGVVPFPPQISHISTSESSSQIPAQSIIFDRQLSSVSSSFNTQPSSTDALQNCEDSPAPKPSSSESYQ